MKKYHFSLGDSSHGPVGFCATVPAVNKVEAVMRLKEALRMFNEQYILPTARGSMGVDYITVYFNADSLTTADIDFIEE